METADMGKVFVEATIYNVNDLTEAKFGRLPPDKVRKVTVAEARVDTGATSLGLPKRLLDQLGLTKESEKQAVTPTGVRTVSVYDAARVEIMGRTATVDPMEVADECPVLIGYIPLEQMDWVVDVKAQKLIGNPAHGGEHVLDLL
ncbi:MAG: aspartyl protease family protein [Gemmataceae bacterium]|nr:aspartyl protease family protein [Gemmataceae bacterium]